MDSRLLKPYNPAETEPRIYKEWQDSGFFNPDNLPGRHKKPFTIMMPPPNVTGILHMGHALMLTLEDIMIRYKRMRGFKTLWLPGTDHAAIATQSRVEKDIQKSEGKSRHDLGREEFLKRVSAFAQASHDTITSQVRAMGASCDWSREAFTLDDKRSFAVRTAFKKMYDDGLIYRGYRIVNWDPKGQTTISDDEIVYEAREATLYTFTYSKDFPIAISTTRPETKVGDTAVAVHPSDERYKQYIGKEYDANFCGVPIHVRIVADESVEKDFGTGALGVTPAHSMADWDMGKRHDLPVKPVINEYAKMTVGDERIMGKKTTDARAAIVAWLSSEGLLMKEEKISQNIATAERTGGIVEPLPKLQWFVDVNKKFRRGLRRTSLKDIMRKPVAQGKIKIVPDYFGKTYFHWIDKLNDWCISRQIWYGHQIPVWYKGKEVYCGVNPPEDSGWEQDPDTLDTWFSSALWTFSTLGWPEKTHDLKLYHPTDILETGYEIIFFWVARMIMMSGYVLGDIPFSTVYFHGTVRDGQGRKMSKSLGNGLDPVEVAAKYGTDAGRMALIAGTAPGTDSKIDENKIKGYKHFANKLWNIARFVLSHEDKLGDKIPTLTETDKRYVEELNTLMKEITSDMERLQFHIASEKIYQYVWHRFADVILEEAKTRLNGSSEAEKLSAAWTLFAILGNCLKVLHPFMPYLTEELWSMAPCKGERKLLMIEEWPVHHTP